MCFSGAVHLAQLKLREFRNYEQLDLAFPPGFHLLLGDNAQGKTNILESIYLLATLRSFRGVGGSQMVRHGQKGYFVGATVVSREEDRIRMYWSRRERKLTLNDQPVKRLAEYLGVLRAVVFCTEDLQLVKGPAARRRRFMDLLLSQTDSSYLAVLQRYMRAVRSRNALLRQPGLDRAALEGFSREVVRSGSWIMAKRAEMVPRFAPLAQQAYGRIAREQEELRVRYQPSVRSDFAVELAQSREREQSYRSTLVGPHRDELELALGGKSAAQFGSEGQKRTLSIALKMAQAEFMTDALGVPPVLLIDDVMGELDLKRRSGLLPLLERVNRGSSQVFMTATEQNWPEELGSRTMRWQVAGGGVRRER